MNGETRERVDNSGHIHGGEHSIVFKSLWILGEVPTEWRIANLALVFKKDQKDYLGSYKMVSL